MRFALSLVAGAVACAGCLPALVRAQDFTRELSPAEQAAIGLAKLTPAERAALVAAVERYRERTGSPSPDTTAPTEATASAADGAAPRTASAPASADTATEKPGPSAVATAGRTVRSWIPFLKDDGAKPAPPKPAAPAASDEVVTRLKDDLRSFSGRRSFILENGDVWEMAEPGSYSGPVLSSPEVILRPGILGTYVLKIPDAALRVRVRRAGPR
jgi:hypothetical protein